MLPSIVGFTEIDINASVIHENRLKGANVVVSSPIYSDRSFAPLLCQLGLSFVSS